MERKRLLAALVGLLLLIAAGSCGDDGDDGDEVERQRFDLVIGNPAPLTGDLAGLGAASEKATELALDQINSAISETGADVSVQIVYGDGGGGPAAAAQAADTMVEANGVSCLVGSWTAGDTLEIAKSVSIPDGVLQISPAPGNDEVTALQDDELVNSLAPATPSSSEEASAFSELYASSKPNGVGGAPFAAAAFDATILCYLAAVAAGSADGEEMALRLIDNTAPAGAEYGWQELPDAVEAIEAGEDINYTGASGPIDMDENGNASTSPSGDDNADSP
jgi:ABC-type branched-subunit amino acid transport system substrate-binding protein